MEMAAAASWEQSARRPRWNSSCRKKLHVSGFKFQVGIASHQFRADNRYYRAGDNGCEASKNGLRKRGETGHKWDIQKCLSKSKIMWIGRRLKRASGVR